MKIPPWAMDFTGDLVGGTLGAMLHGRWQKTGKEAAPEQTEGKAFEQKREKLFILLENMDQEDTENINKRWIEATKQKKEDRFTYLLSRLIPDNWPADRDEKEKLEDNIKEAIRSMNSLEVGDPEDDELFEQKLARLEHAPYLEKFERAYEWLRNFSEERRPEIKKMTLAMQRARRNSRKTEERWSIFRGFYYSEVKAETKKGRLRKWLIRSS